MRNFDYLPMVRPLYTMRRTQPSQGLRSLDFTMAPFAGAVDGVNEKGLCIAYNYAYTTDVPPKPSAPISRFEEILEADRPLNLENLQRIMADHGGQDLPTDTTICVHGTYWTTTASLQLFPRSRRIRVAYDYACRAQHEELAL